MTLPKSFTSVIITKVCHFAHGCEQERKQGMILVAVALGLIVGFGGFSPLIFGMNMARKASPTSNLGHAGSLLLGVLLSLVILAVATIVCVLAARDMAVPFVLAEAGGLIAAAIVFGVTKQLR